MISFLTSIITLLTLSSVVTAAFDTIAYRATIKPFSNTSSTPASGFVTIFTESSKSVISYSGIVTNLQSNLLASTCTAVNGCGVHIHAGRSCFNTTTPGPHYFINTTFPIDPWINERYSTDATGKANFQSIVQIGSIDIEGRAFLVHSQNGTRIGCGIIERIPVGDDELLSTVTLNRTKSNVSSNVIVRTVDPDVACYFGFAQNLEPSLTSYLNPNTTLMEKDCNFTNGCGVHIHSGDSCFNGTTQGGHYYNKTTYSVDPWLFTMYDATDSNGDAYFTGCVETGVSSFINRPFIIHSNNGIRVSCGLLTKATIVPTPTFDIIAYRVTIKPFSNTSNTPAKGFVSIFTEPSKSVIGYSGIVTNLESNLLASTCTAVNGCGVHIHAGRSCFNTTTPGPHYFINTTFPIDPWINERYSTDATGKANFQSVVQIGSVDIEGRTFLVHSQNGTRIGCGIIERVLVGDNQLTNTTTSNLTKASVSSKVVVRTVDPGVACYFGFAQNLEPNLISYLNDNATLMGKDCNFTNGCGVHIHNGVSCFNSTTQGGHYYNKTTYSIDPWLYTMYHATDSNGNAYFTGCVETGVSSFINRPFIIHSNNGTRVSCGLLMGSITVPITPDVPTPTPPVPTPTPPIPTAPIPSPVAPTGGKKQCGLFGLSIFCPLTFCGIFGRLFGLCK